MGERDDLADVLEAAMQWVAGNIENYAPKLTWTPTLVQQRFGFLLDLTITSAFLEARETPVAPSAGVALDRAAEVFHCESFHEALLSIPGRFPYYLWMLAILWRHDRLADNGLRTEAQRLIDERHPELADPSRPTDRRLELRYILDLGGFHTPPHSEPPLTLPSESGVEDAYRLTHIVFFLSRFGRRPLPELADEITHVDDLLTRYTQAAHWDLVAELVMCRSILGQPPATVEEQARKELIRAQLPNGAMPGPAFDVATNAVLPTAAHRAADVFLHCYHTTLAVMMCAGADSPAR